MKTHLTLRSVLAAATLSLAACGGSETDPAALSADSLTDALGASAADGGAGTEKVLVCHIPPGNPANAHTIEVGAPAVQAHLNHGDTLGACGGADAGTGDDGAGDTDGGFDDGTGGGDGQTDAGTGGGDTGGGDTDGGQTDGGVVYN